MKIDSIIIKPNSSSIRADYVSRLLPNDGVTVEGLVHPKIKYSFEEHLVAFYIITPIPHGISIARKLNQYAALAAQKQFDKGRKCNFFFDIILKPFWALFKVYVLNLGFLDGTLSLNHYSYTLQKYVRLYTLHQSGGKL